MITVKQPAAAKAALLGAVIITSVAALAGTTPLTVVASGMCLALIILLLWRGDDPPILLMPALFQWSEVATWPLSTVWEQVPLNDLGSYGANLESSALYGLAGVAALAVGLRLGSRRSRGALFVARLRTDAFNWRFREVALVAFAAMGSGYVLAMISTIAGPARELFNQASNIKYAGLFVLAYWCMLRGSHYRVLWAVMAFEVVFGMTGFFAEFKNSILTLVVAALTARPRLRRLDLMLVGSAGAVLVSVAIFWSAVKVEYRLLLNQGTGQQVVVASLSDRLGYLANSARSMDAARFADGFNRLVARHGYIEFLGLTMQNVPAAMPHENGQLTLAVISHIAMPRFLFPNKPSLPNDTEVMAKYTGLSLLYSWDSNTSISIGHLGELYIDFGFIGGLVAMGVIGWLVGFVYSKLRGNSKCPPLISAGLCLMVTLPIAYFGTAYIKLMGAFVFSSAVAVVTQRFGLPIVLPMLLGWAARPRPSPRQR